MTVSQILSGAVADRACHAIHLMTEPEARGYLISIENGMPKSRRGKIIRLMAENPVARLSPEARELYRAYAVAYGA